MTTTCMFLLYLCYLCLFLTLGIAREAVPTGTGCSTFENICENFNDNDDGGEENEEEICKCDDGFHVSGGKCDAQDKPCNYCVNRPGCFSNSEDECVMTCDCSAEPNDDSDSRRSRCYGIRIAVDTDGSPPNCKALVEGFCETGHTCINREERRIICECKDGFVYDKDTGNCQTERVLPNCYPPDHFCEDDRICIDISQRVAHICGCANGRQCQDNFNTIDSEHQSIHCKPLTQFCNNGHICMDDSKEGQVTCDCGDGFIYNAEKGLCEEIVSPDCQPLKQFCGNGNICLDNSHNFAHITCECSDESPCNDIYKGLDADHRSLKCKRLNQFCENGRICVDESQNGEVECKCEPGYAYNRYNGTCEDIDECVDKGPFCTVVVCKYIHDRQYQCSCGLDGNNLSVLPCDLPAKCINTSPCLEHSVCKNTIGSFHCQCMTGYQMSLDELTCEAVPTSKPTTKSDETSTTSKSDVVFGTTSDDSQVFEKHQSESSKISLPTIVVPIVVLLIAVGVGLVGVFLIRKRCSRSQNSKQAKADCKENCINQTSVVNDNHFETLQERGSTGVVYNCIDIEPGNIYSTIDMIDTEDVSQPSKSKDNFVKDKLNETSQPDNHDYHILKVQDHNATINNEGFSCDIKGDSNNETGYQIPYSKDTVYQDAHNYLAIEPEYTHLSTDLRDKSCKHRNEQLEAACKQTVHTKELVDPKSNTYFILEPHTSETPKNENECIDETDQKFGNTHGLPAQASSLREDNHKYFVLDSEGRNTSCVSQVPSSMKKASNYNFRETAGSNNIEIAGNPDYFILEPNPNLQRPESKVSQIQTLPDNEYNLLSMKLKEIK